MSKEAWSRSKAFLSSGSQRKCVFASADRRSAAHMRDPTSCSAMKAASGYCRSRMSTVRGTLFTDRALHISSLRGCQPKSGETSLIMWTMTASKMAWQRAWSGTEIFSSCGSIAGYFAAWIGLRSSKGALAFAAPSNRSDSSKNHFLHLPHHPATSFSSPSYMLITVGRQAVEPSASASVFVALSGIESRRLSPSDASWTKPLIILRLRKCSTQ
mmetsp:Transcript_16679/g.56352  ORF Transcript_16679/g.56352 Transcript_16679/m.56352 type:complete len:214 (-) Transcript_16679:404-1045(-)